MVLELTKSIHFCPHYVTEVRLKFTGDGSVVFFSESAGLSYISVSLVHSSLETDLTFNVLVTESGTASEGIVKLFMG